MVDAEHALLVEEYCGGTDDYQLSLPKGLIEPGEDVLDAANRELKEEAGFGARHLELLAELSLSPGYMSQKIQVVLAQDLYEERLPGDEPEPMRVDKTNLRELSEPDPAAAVHRGPCPGGAVSGPRRTDAAWRVFQP